MGWGVRIFVCELCNRCKVEGRNKWYRSEKQTQPIKQIIKNLRARTLCESCKDAFVDILKTVDKDN